jgi:hypothetical protein
MHVYDILSVGYGYTKYISVRRHCYIICMFRALQVIEWLISRYIQKVASLNLAQ